jgi:hypothetical protein
MQAGARILLRCKLVFLRCAFCNCTSSTCRSTCCCSHYILFNKPILLSTRQTEPAPSEKKNTTSASARLPQYVPAHLGPYAAGPVSTAFHRCPHAPQHLPTAFTRHFTRSLREQCVHLALGPLQYSCQPQNSTQTHVHKLKLSSGSFAVLSGNFWFYLATVPPRVSIPSAKCCTPVQCTSSILSNKAAA